MSLIPRAVALAFIIAAPSGHCLCRAPAGLPSVDEYPIFNAVNVTVTQLTDQLNVSYARVGGINHLDGKNLPSKTAFASITADLLTLLLPGFFDEKSIHSSELKVEMVSLMDSLLGRPDDGMATIL